MSECVYLHVYVMYDVYMHVHSLYVLNIFCAVGHL